jgi:hypothetical protein
METQNGTTIYISTEIIRREKYIIQIQLFSVSDISFMN